MPLHTPTLEVVLLFVALVAISFAFARGAAASWRYLKVLRDTQSAKSKNLEAKATISYHALRVALPIVVVGFLANAVLSAVGAAYVGLRLVGAF